jgi:hypothetical protein
MTTYKIQGIVILATCSDGKHREVQLDPAGAMSVKRTLLHVSHQKIRLYRDELAIVPAGESRFARAMKKLFSRNGSKPNE